MEKLMAEQIVESENLKKDFFTISAINQRKKFQSLNQNNFLKTPMKQPRIIPRNKSRSITY